MRGVSILYSVFPHFRPMMGSWFTEIHVLDYRYGRYIDKYMFSETLIYTRTHTHVTL